MIIIIKVKINQNTPDSNALLEKSQFNDNKNNNTYAGLIGLNL